MRIGWEMLLIVMEKMHEKNLKNKFVQNILFFLSLFLFLYCFLLKYDAGMVL